MKIYSFLFVFLSLFSFNSYAIGARANLLTTSSNGNVSLYFETTDVTIPDNKEVHTDVEYLTVNHAGYPVFSEFGVEYKCKDGSREFYLSVNDDKPSVVDSEGLYQVDVGVCIGSGLEALRGVIVAAKGPYKVKN